MSSDYKNSIENAVKLIREYGLILEKNSAFHEVDINLLPSSKENIKNAFKQLARHSILVEKDTTKLDLIVRGYMLLATFQKVESTNNIDKLSSAIMEIQANNLDAKDAANLISKLSDKIKSDGSQYNSDFELEQNRLEIQSYIQELYSISQKNNQS